MFTNDFERTIMDQGQNVLNIFCRLIFDVLRYQRYQYFYWYGFSNVNAVLLVNFNRGSGFQARVNTPNRYKSIMFANKQKMSGDVSYGKVAPLSLVIRFDFHKDFIRFGKYFLDRQTAVNLCEKLSKRQRSEPSKWTVI